MAELVRSKGDLKEFLISMKTVNIVSRRRFFFHSSRI